MVQQDMGELLQDMSHASCKQSDFSSTKSLKTDNGHDVLLVEALLAEQHESVESLLASFLQKKMQN